MVAEERDFSSVIARFPVIHGIQRLVDILRRTSTGETEPPMTPVNNDLATIVGRFVAACVHPYAAWRAFSAPKRLLIAIGYFAAAFISVLTALLLSSAPFAR